jgi:hypothetical protein
MLDLMKTELGLIFINGARVLPRDIPAWLGHEATDIPSDEENEDKTVEEANSWTEIVLEDDGTVAITVPFHTSVCCKEVFISHPALDKHMSVLLEQLELFILVLLLIPLPMLEQLHREGAPVCSPRYAG